MSNARPAAALLGACAILVLFASVHHPFVHGHGATQLVSQVSHLGAIDGIFHALMILFVLAMLYALRIYTQYLRASSQVATAAIILLSTGSGAIIAAALIDGFFIPEFASKSLTMPAQTALAIIGAGAVGIQILSKLGFTAYGAAALLWGIDLLSDGGRARFTGAAVAFCGVALAFMTLLGGPLTPHSLAPIALLQAAWSIIIAVRMWNA